MMMNDFRGVMNKRSQDSFPEGIIVRCSHHCKPTSDSRLRRMKLCSIDNHLTLNMWQTRYHIKLFLLQTAMQILKESEQVLFNYH